MADAADQEDEEDLPERRLIESTLYKEDVFTGGHFCVWGSFYDADTSRWGYACCESTQRASPCSVAAEAEATHKASKPESSEEYSTDSDKDVEQKKQIDWFSDPPPEFLPREKFGKASAFVEHFVRFAVGAWKQWLDKGCPDCNDMEKMSFLKSLPETVAAVTPLIKKLKKGESLQKGEKKEVQFLARSRETRTSMEGKFLGEASVIGQLEEMATFSYERNYVAAHKAYMRLTLGHKTWNNTLVQHVSACTMKGAREYRRNRDNLNTYDMDPVSQKYMHGMRKLVHFTQVVRKCDDHSKNVVL